MQQFPSLAYHYNFDLVYDKNNYIRAVGGYALLTSVVSELKKMIKKKNSFKMRVEIGPPETFLS
ncbi:hypothetical protein N7486_006553 [Penicillium sp. IBT 16267x]|nr:hypothetical protein N7486_006553 [Penicillium sp. IBT 16267x]